MSFILLIYTVLLSFVSIWLFRGYYTKRTGYKFYRTRVRSNTLLLRDLSEHLFTFAALLAVSVPFFPGWAAFPAQVFFLILMSMLVKVTLDSKNTGNQVGLWIRNQMREFYERRDYEAYRADLRMGRMDGCFTDDATGKVYYLMDKNWGFESVPTNCLTKMRWATRPDDTGVELSPYEVFTKYEKTDDTVVAKLKEEQPSDVEQNEETEGAQDTESKAESVLDDTDEADKKAKEKNEKLKAERKPL